MAAQHSATTGKSAGNIPDFKPDFKQVDADQKGSITLWGAARVPGLAELFTQVNRDADGRLSQEEEDAWEDLKAGLKQEGETLGKAIDHSLRRFE